MDKKDSCSCIQCVLSCWHSPGWFGSIEEVEGAAKLLNIPVKEFAKEYLIQEWWAGQEEVSIPAPRKKLLGERHKSFGNLDLKTDPLLLEECNKNGKGFVKATWGHNLIIGYACVFLENGLCKIHNSKPKECRESLCCDKNDKFNRESLIEYWKQHQDFIKMLEE